ncbi:MAG: MBL fold metallo-hydrolase, partial [Kiritimatiellae bacterium]|nr:MBL fold metallo-hydrolase [Kiritimatiellia bacterium]
MNTPTITFLGTGADDWDWTDFTPGTPGSTATLVGATLLIDAGPTVARALGPAAARIRDILVTHSHSDHFRPATIAAIANAAPRRRLRVWGSPQALANIDPALCDLKPILPGAAFRAAGLAITALPANHVSRDPSEQALHYLLKGPGMRLLYAIDGAWMRSDARRTLKTALDGKPLTAIVWDATCGATFDDWRFAEHNDLRMIASMRNAMLKDGLCSPGTLHVFDHIAR